MTEDRKKRWITWFVLWHWTLAIPWLLPFGETLSKLRVFSDLYYFTTGTWQAWYMFAGAPRGSVHLVSDVHYGDGSSVRYELPTVAEMGELEAWWAYRYREFEHRLVSGHRLHVVRPEVAWNAWARWVASEVDSGDRAPAWVVLQQCGLPTPTLAESHAALGWVDYTATLRDPTLWTCEVFHTLVLLEGS